MSHEPKAVLQTLGAISLGDGADVKLGRLSTRPKLLALLVYLHVAAPRGPHRRDTLLALFWPELDQERARRSLRQALYELRQALGPDAVLSRGEQEVLAGCNVMVDVVEFDRRVAQGDHRGALSLYKGDFLSGFHISGCGDFDDWHARERERLRQAAASAAWSLAEDRESAGDGLEAASWGREAVAMQPFAESGVRRLMLLLDRLGDRAGALETYETFSNRLKREYDTEPAPETQRCLAGVLQRRYSNGSVVDGVDDPPLMAHPASAHVPALAPRRPRLGRLIVTLGAAGAVVLGVSLAMNSARSDSRALASLPDVRLAVLPFENLGEPADDFLAHGIAQEIANSLAKIPSLGVIARSLVADYDTAEKAVDRLAADLQVDYVLEGSVQWQREDTAGTVRITPRLTRVADRTQIWSSSFDEDVRDVLAVQSDIAARVASTIGVIASAAGPPATRSLEAYFYYLRGNEFLARGPTLENLRLAATMYRRAIDVDSSYALAYAKLSLTDGERYFALNDRTAERRAAAWMAARTALRLQPDLPEAHLAIGKLYYYDDRDFDRALEEFAIAERHQPANADLLRAMAYVVRRKGDYEQAAVYQERAISVNPETAEGRGAICWTYIMLRRIEDAERHCVAAVALFPDQPGFYDNLVWHYLLADGNTARARAVLAKKPPHPPYEDEVLIDWADLEILDRNYAEALQRTSDTRDSLRRHEQRAWIFRQLRQPDSAAAHYEAAESLLRRRLERDPALPYLQSRLGLVYAGLGRHAEAVASGVAETRARPITEVYAPGYAALTYLAKIHTIVGDYEAAVETLSFLLSNPGDMTVPILGLDPLWDPLRDHPGFRRLVARQDQRP